MQFDLTDEIKRLQALNSDWRVNFENCFTYKLRDDGGLWILLNEEWVPFPNFKLRPYQTILLKEIFVDGYRRFFMNLPRRSGKDMLCFIIIVMMAIMYPGKGIYCYPQCNAGNHILWEASSYFNLNGQHLAIRYLDMIPRGIIDRINSTDKSIYLKNGASLWFTGSDHNVDKLRGMNAICYILSEYAYFRSDAVLTQAVLPAITENGGLVIVQTTLKGMNHAYVMREKIRNNPTDINVPEKSRWRLHLETVETLVDVNGNRYITDEMVNADRQTMSEAKIRQEYYNDVSMDSNELYFALELEYIYNSPFEPRILPNLVHPGRPMYAFYDIGIHDPTACVIAQFREDRQIDIVNYFEGNNTALKLHLQRAEQFAFRHNSRIAKHFLPHDGANRNVFDGKPTTIALRELGFTVDVVPTKNKDEGIEAVRVALSAASFNQENTSQLLNCLSNYRKEYNPSTKTYKHVHDWASHGVDAMQTLALAYMNKMVAVPQQIIRDY